MLQSQCYNWKAGATDESEDLRKKRMAVKRKARQAAEDKFDENKVASKNERRRKRYAEQKAAWGVSGRTTERRKFYTEYVHFWPVFGIRWNTAVFHCLPHAATV